MSALDKQVGGSHYRNGGIQPIQYIEANGLQFLEASVVKRVTRHNQPGGKGRQDIEKAIHELELLLELRYDKPQKEEVKVAVADMVKKALVSPRCYVCGSVEGHGDLPCPFMTPAAGRSIPSDSYGPWKDWAGGKSPVAFDTKVEVTLRDGASIKAAAESLRWSHEGSAEDILAYRVIIEPAYAANASKSR